MRPTTTYRLKVALACALALAGGTSAIAFATAASFPDLSVPVASDLGLVRESRADAAVQRSRASAPGLNRAVIEAVPMTSAAWLRIAYLQTLDGGVLQPSGLDALERSYAIAPYGPDVSLWRIAFIYGRWRQMTPSLRAQAASELQILTRARGNVFDVRTIPDLEGRFSAQMTQAAADNLRGIDRATAKVSR